MTAQSGRLLVLSTFGIGVVVRDAICSPAVDEPARFLAPDSRGYLVLADLHSFFDVMIRHPCSAILSTAMSGLTFFLDPAHHVLFHPLGVTGSGLLLAPSIDRQRFSAWRRDHAGAALLSDHVVLLEGARFRRSIFPALALLVSAGTLVRGALIVKRS